MAVHPSVMSPPAPHAGPGEALEALLSEGQTWGDSAEWLPVLPSESVDLWFTSPPYADARAYSRIHPDHYVEWFLPYGKLMLEATKNTGWLVLNIKNRAAKSAARPTPSIRVPARAGPAAARMAMAGDLHLV